jgi:hypothetical protein
MVGDHTNNEKDYNMRNCFECGGTGIVPTPADMLPGPANINCYYCNGAGTVAPVSAEELERAYAAIRLPKAPSKISKMTDALQELKEELTQPGEKGLSEIHRCTTYTAIVTGIGLAVFGVAPPLALAIPPAATFLARWLWRKGKQEGNETSDARANRPATRGQESDAIKTQAPSA